MRSTLIRCCLAGIWLALGPLVGACTDATWNNPYASSNEAKNVLYASFSERPKHLDPVRSYSANEYEFIAQIYEPPLQYHFLKRPYVLEPLTAEGLPEIAYLDKQGQVLERGASDETVEFIDYFIRIRPGIHFQPHPAFAKDDQGRYRYHRLRADELVHIHALADFPETGARELTAQDYVYQIKRLANPRLHSPIAGVMGQYILGFTEFRDRLNKIYQQQGLASGLSAWIDLRNYPLSGVEALDRYTYRIRLQHKYPQFQYWLAMPFFAPMPWEAERFYAQPGMAERNIVLDWYPVGTGPFMLAENNPNLRMVLERNPNFHGERYPHAGEATDKANGLLEDAGRALPFIGKAVYSLEKENIPYWNKFLQGYYDTSGITSDSFDQAIHFNRQGEIGLTDVMKAKGINLASAVNASTIYMGFNMLDPLVGGDSERARKLRRAIAIAVDFEEYISIFANGRGIAAQGPIPPGIHGYRDGKGGINPYVYDWMSGRARRNPPEEARRLMAEAGYADGIDTQTGQPLVLYFDTVGAGPDAKARLNWMRKQFAKIGVQLVIRNTDYNRFQDKMRQGTAQIFQWGWNADYPDPENFLFLLYGPNGKKQAQGENASNYRNQEYDRLFERMKSMDNGTERQAVIDRMVEIVRYDAPWLFGFHPKSFSLFHAWVHNVKPNLMANNTLKYKRLDFDLRKRARAQWNRPVLWPLALLAMALGLFIFPAFISYRRRERRAAL